jgi:hypothetical protein
MRSAPAIAALACALALAAAPAPAQAGADGFTGFEKKLTAVTAAGEPEIAVGPHGAPLLVAFNGCGIAVSHDRGARFTVAGKSPADPGPTPGDPYHYCSDPVAALGPRNTLYTGAGYWDTPGGSVDVYNMYVARSRDGGATWTRPVFATGDNQLPQQLLLGRNTGHADRLFVTVDPSNGTVYASATDFPRLVRWVVVSHDGGATFGPPHAIDSNLYPQAQGEEAGDYVPAAAHGVLAYVYAASAAPGRTCPCGIFETSRDGGVSWTRRAAPFTANWTAADPSHPGHFAIMGGQGATATPTNPGYVTVSTTSNYGRTWTKPVRIGQAPLHPRIQPWIAYSPRGVLGVGYKTLNTDTIAQPTFLADALLGQLPGTYDYWTTVSFDDGRTFSTPLKVSNAPSPRGNSAGNDDFSSVALDDDYLYAAWGDQRTSPTDATAGPVSVYLARVPLTAYSKHP